MQTFIPEEPIEHVRASVEDLKEAVQAQTQAILIFSQRINVATELLAKVHEAVTKPADGGGLSDLLEQLIDADKRHAAALQQVLAAVRT